jgi:4-hydroxybenzoate polyprenyltransferase
MSRRVLNTAIFSLIRWPNLLITAIVQYLLYFKVLVPVFSLHEITPSFDWLRFSMLVLVTMCIAAGGYIVNDIMDVRTDLINRPDRTIISKRMAPQTASWLYFMFQLVGFICWLYLVFYLRQIPLLGIFPLLIGGLALYSLYLKRLPLVGNVLIALFCAAVPGIVWLIEHQAFIQLSAADVDAGQRLRVLFIWYMASAFALTLYRELVKDIEDVKGDQAAGLRTLPVIWGVSAARYFTVAIAVVSAVVVGAMLWQFQDEFQGWRLVGYGTTVLLPIVISILLLFRAQTAADYRRLSHWAKWIILMGLLLPLWI